MSGHERAGTDSEVVETGSNRMANPRRRCGLEAVAHVDEVAPRDDQEARGAEIGPLIAFRRGESMVI